MTMLEIDGSRYSGSGTIVRQAMVFAALTGQAVHMVKARARRLKPGLRPQHMRVVEAIRQVVGGQTEGVELGAQEFTFWPATPPRGQQYLWDIGSAELDHHAGAGRPARPGVGRHPSAWKSVVASSRTLRRRSTICNKSCCLWCGAWGSRRLSRWSGRVMCRVGVAFCISRCTRSARDSSGSCWRSPGAVERVWGIALASHLAERRVSQRMAEAARGVLTTAGYRADIEVQDDTSALQPGAALALFVDLAGLPPGSGPGGARRQAEAIGRYVAQHLLEDLQTGATLDRYTADQLIPFAALAAGKVGSASRRSPSMWRVMPGSPRSS